MKVEIHNVAAEVANGSAIHRAKLLPQHFAVIQRMLSKDIYSNPLRASIQEYASNARDAHVERDLRGLGNRNTPIEIWLPTEFSPELVIGDHGLGINDDRMVNVFGNIAASTKRDDDTQLGGWGLGSKTGFAVSETFYVETTADDAPPSQAFSLWTAPDHQQENISVRKHRVWAHFKDNGLNSFTMMSEREATGEDTGSKIKLPIEDAINKVGEMIRYIKSIMAYWEVRPIIHNIPESGFEWPNPVKILDGEGWELVQGVGKDVVALVGFIPYVMESDQLSRIGIDYRGQNTLVMRFNTGDIPILPTRENIDYSGAAPALIERYQVFNVEAPIKIQQFADSKGQLGFREFMGVVGDFGLEKVNYLGKTISGNVMRSSHYLTGEVYRAYRVYVEREGGQGDWVVRRDRISQMDLKDFFVWQVGKTLSAAKLRAVAFAHPEICVDAKGDVPVDNSGNDYRKATFIALCYDMESQRDRHVNDYPQFAWLGNCLDAYKPRRNSKPIRVRERLYTSRLSSNMSSVRGQEFVDEFLPEKLKGIYAFYRNGRIVDWSGNQIQLKSFSTRTAPQPRFYRKADRCRSGWQKVGEKRRKRYAQEPGKLPGKYARYHNTPPVYFFKWSRWGKGMDADLLRSAPGLVYYTDMVKAREQRDSVRRMAQLNPAQRKAKIVVVIGKKERPKFMRFLTLKPFRNIRRRIKELEASEQMVAPKGILQVTPDIDDLMRFAYPAAHFINFDDVRPKDWKFLVKILRPLDHRLILWSDITDTSSKSRMYRSRWGYND